MENLSGNKGEWSEVYALFKLLGDGIVYAGDGNLNKIWSIFFPIIRIIREDNKKIFHYSYDKSLDEADANEDRNVVIQASDGKELLRVKSSVFLLEAEKLLHQIYDNNHSFVLKDTEQFMNMVYCYSIKAQSQQKADIRIVLHDFRTHIQSEMGFSIKSKLGSRSTLLNASNATNFTYEITGVDLSEEEIQAINSLNNKKTKVIDRYRAIRNKGGEFVFKEIEDKIFFGNLIMLDGNLPFILSCMLLEQLESGKSDLNSLAKILSEKNPLNFEMAETFPFYEYKIKHLLTAIALGMVPKKPWHGKYEANGGYLIVKEDGEILCYHFYDRNRFEDYLFYNLQLERSSTTRHQYAEIVRKENKLLFKINLQIRFK